MIGAREATEVAFFNPLRNMINRASASHLHALVVPGPEVALAAGLDLRTAGLTLAAGPRQANVLLLLTPLSDKMLAAASVAYAQMPRPRMVLVLGESSYAPLPKPDAIAPLTPEGLKQAVGTLRQIMATQGFAAKVEDFDAPSLQSRIQYTCPMHPEIIQDEPGSCPKCGMFLVPKETSAMPDPHDHAAMAAPEPPHEAHTTDKTAKYVCPMHPEVTSDEPGSCPKCGMFLEEVKDASDEDHHDHTEQASAAKYTCPMHPEVTSDEPGSCPKCGMFLEEVKESSGEGLHDHAHHDASETAAKYVCPMHPEVTSDEPGSCPKCGMFLEEVKSASDEGHQCHDDSSSGAPAKYTCPMHPEVTSDTPGNCPKCGMNLVKPDEETTDHSHHHASHDPSEGAAKYVCPMHPEVTSDEPGSCPKCGMFLEEVKEASGENHQCHDHAPADAPAKYTCPMHPEVTSDTPGNCPKCGMNLVEAAKEHEGGPHEHASMAAHAPTASVSSEGSSHAAHGSSAKYVCPMHPEVTSDEPGSCPKCGMFLEEVKDAASEDEHAHHSASETAAKYICPMHPEVTSDAPGSCPKCGMFLEEVKDASGEGHRCHDHAPADAPAKYTCPMHPEITSDTPGNCPKCGMNLVEAAEQPHEGHEGHAQHDTSETAAYVCPMHPEVTSDAPGNCPKCGMNLVKAAPAESGHAGGHDHGGGSALLDGLVGLEPGFMSMIEMTDGTPRSSNGLQMEWITTPFGPFFPGLPGGLTLELELDGDTVVSAKTGSLTGPQDLLQNGPRAAAEYVAALGAQMPLATVAYRLLACRAIEAAAKATPTDEIKTTRRAALARERITSHLLWLSQLGRQLGLKGIEREAATLHLLVHAAAPKAITALGPRLKRLASKARRTWFLSRRLATVGTLPPDAAWDGPTSADTTAAGRLAARLAEISTSLSEVTKATSLTPPALADIGQASGTGQASVQTARGLASLQVELRAGAVVSATLETPSSRHVSLVNPLIEQQELADALVAIASLDLSPWELPA